MRKPRWQCRQKQIVLAELSARGLSAGQIAELIGETRNAVKNAMARYGLYASPRRSRKPITLAQYASLD
jgi:hypothetical protein